ncbi:hypothetical protein EGT07_01530 [Herbaspirillum sp. HC18]|nr:hypothetical protein EGT07_01530 [Herbaspirillum sp. HC18]
MNMQCLLLVSARKTTMPSFLPKSLPAIRFHKFSLRSICAAVAMGAFVSACGGGGGGTGSSSPGSGSAAPVSGSLSLVAGSTGGAGFILDGPAASARFAGPDGIAVDSAGNIYVTDQRTLRKISGQTVSTVVPATQQVVTGWLATDGSGNLYYSASSGMRRLSAAGVDTPASFPATASYPFVFDAQGNFYFSELHGGVKAPIYYTISRQSPAGAVSVLNDISGQPAAFNFPQGMAVDAAGVLYVAESQFTQGGTVQQISKLTPAGQRTALTPPDTATVYGGLAMDASGNLFAPDPVHHIVRKITPAGDSIVFAGSMDVQGSADGKGGIARFNTPNKIAIDAAGNLFVADSGNHTVRKIATDGAVTTVAGVASGRIFGSADGVGAAAQFGTPQGVTADAAGNLYVADTGSHTIRKITPAGAVTTLAGRAGVSGRTDGAAADARFNLPTDVAVDAAGNVYVADSGNVTVRKITPEGVVSTLAGGPCQSGIQDGVGTAACFSHPQGLTIDTAGNLFMTDSSDTSIRKITPAGVVTTFAGSIKFSGLADGVGTAAQLNAPHGITIDRQGNLYVADTGNCALRKITPNANVTTVPNTRGNFCGAIGIAADSTGNLYVTSVNQGASSSAYNLTVVRVTQDGIVTTVAGKPDQQRIELGALPGSIEPSYGITRLDDRHFALTSAGSVLKISID